MLREPKLSIEPAFLFLYSVSNTCFRTLFSTWYQSARVENLYNRHNLKKKSMKKNRLKKAMATKTTDQTMSR